MPHDAFSDSIVMRGANQFGGMFLSCSGTRRSILRYNSLALSTVKAFLYTVMTLND